MALKVGIVGLPNVGKSTLFQALTHTRVDTSNYPFATIEPNIGIVEVDDARVDALADFSKSKKRIRAVIEFVDIAGLVKGASTGEGLGNQFLAHIREVDAIVEVVRAFEGGDVIHVETSIDPDRDRDIIETELLMADLATAEKALARYEKEAKSGVSDARARHDAAREIVQHLRAGKHTPDVHAENARNMQLLIAKPILYLYNTNEENGHPTSSEDAGRPNYLRLNIKLEEELSRMSQEEHEELGIVPHLQELAARTYALLSLISFFTTGEDETRAWSVPQGSTVRRAGRAIHSDFEEKFIRAEVIYWEDLVRAGSYARARELGLTRTEGKDYLVRDGDVIVYKI